MGSRKLMALIAGAVTLFVLGYLFYGVLLRGFFEANATAQVMRDPPTWWALVVGQFAWAWLLIYVLGRGPAAMSFGGGATVGAVVGLLGALSVDLVMFATTSIMTLTAALVDPVVFAVMSGIAGGIIAVVLRGRAAAAA